MDLYNEHDYLYVKLCVPRNVERKKFSHLNLVKESNRAANKLDVNVSPGGATPPSKKLRGRTGREWWSI